VTTVSVVTPSGGGGTDVELPEAIFGASVNIPLIHQVVVAQLAAARQGTHATKTRGAVRGGGRKPYRQKGTGRARQGSLRAPQYAGGGTVHGPVPRSYAQRTPKKMKAAALRDALSDRTSHGRVAVVSAFVEGGEPSTAAALTVLRTAIGAPPARLPRPVLVVVGTDDAVSAKSLRNVPAVRVLASGQLNAHDVLACDHVVFTQAALAEFVARVSGADLVTVDKPAPPKRARAAKPAQGTAEAGTADETASPADGASSTAEAAGTADEAAGEDGSTTAEPPARPARGAGSRARRPATAGTPVPAAGGDEAGGSAGVTHRKARTSGEPASSGSGDRQEEQE
jgi:large subunit ribosomal protein L4